MNKTKKFLVLVLSLAMLTGLAQQRGPSSISYKDVQGFVQRGPLEDWVACPSGSIFSQPPTMPDGAWIATVSDALTEYQAYEKFAGVTQPIGTVHFWGLNIFNVYPYQCSCEDPMTFEITFYQDNAGFPGTVVYSETIAISRDSIGIADPYIFYHYKAVLSNSVDLPAGWISVQGAGTGIPDNCDFYWLDSPVGDLYSLQWWSTNWSPLSNDLSICFEAGTIIVSEIPLAPWGLMIGLALIAGSVFLRYRRII